MKSNFVSQMASKAITSVISMTFLPSDIKCGLKGNKIEMPADFTPVLRFAVCSDIHLDGNENQEAAIRFSNLFEDFYKIAENDNKYNKVDAMLIAGDFTGGGHENQYCIFNKIIDKNIKDETKQLCVLGNHEFIAYRDNDASVGYDVYKKFVNEEVDTVTLINGYYFIGVSYDNDGKSFKTKINWLDNILEDITAKNPDKPVFVFQHPHPFLTVYGSVNWGNIDLRKILSKYPQVIDFSGHSHYAPSDPRSVWQGSFTAIGCGSLSAFMGNLNYIEGDKDAPGKSGGAWLCEVDCNGNVKMRLYDIENRKFFDNIEYYFTEHNDKKKRRYTWHKQKSFDTKPVFSIKPKINIIKTENEEFIISFPEACGYYEAENYKITVKNSKNRKIFEKTVISEYVRASCSDVNVSLGNLPKGKYKVSINSYSPYAKKGTNIKSEIVVD